LEWTGAQILEVIEAVNAGKHRDGTVVNHPPQWAGVKFTIDKTKPEFEQVTEILISCKKVDVTKKYAALTIDFVAGGKDGIIPKEPFTPGDLLAETFAACLRKMTTIKPEILGYIKYI
jgi:hypothetical protein